MTSSPNLIRDHDLAPRYGISPRTLFRWSQSDEVGFPQPIIVNGRKFWRPGDVEAWEARQTDGTTKGKRAA